ncbi:hypothetical protein J6590_053269 [Homalodisca vitripennis]|nr:hypothetical protein J6590_053269 [Homalodisca vitripennis]
MKFLLISAALVAVALGEVPSPPAGWRPSGRLLLLPARLEYPPAVEANATQLPKKTQSDESQPERLLDSGEYYVLLPDGRLQMVKYTTAALREDQEQQTQQFQQPQQFQPQQQFQQSQQFYQQQQFQQSQQFQQQQQYQQPQQFQQLQQQGALQPELQYVQFPLPGSQYAQTKLEYKTPEVEQKAENLEEEPKAVVGFEANVEYRDVKPISAPIYAYNPTPLVRILKR